MTRSVPKSDSSYDLAIVGGGLVGATLAGLLAGTRLRVALIEARAPAGEFPSADAAFDPRVSALTLASRTLLQNIQAWAAIEQSRHSPFRNMYVWDGEGSGEIEFTADELGSPALGYIVENPVILAALYQRLESDQNVELFAPASICDCQRDAAGNHRLTLDSGETLNCALVAGADGGQSRMREYANIAVRESSYDQSAIVTTVQVAKSHQRTAWQRFLSSGPLAFLPLLNSENNEHFCSIVWSLDTPDAEQKLGLCDSEFKLALERAFESRLGEIVTLDKRFAFPLHQRHAERYFNDRVVLVGDAAHTIHPLAGQGVNLGLMDAGVFAEEILNASDRGIDIFHDSVLARYQRRRVAENQLMMSAVRGFKELFGMDALPLRWLRSSGMSLMNRAGPIKQQIAERAMGLSGDIPEVARPDLAVS